MATFEELTTQLFNEASNGIEAKKSIIKNELDSLNLQYNNIDSQIEELRNEINTLDSQLEELRVNIESKESSLQRLENLPEVLQQFQQDIS